MARYTVDVDKQTHARYDIETMTMKFQLIVLK